MNVRPLHDRLVVRRLEEEDRTRGGILIPDTAREQPQQGQVIAAGGGKALEDGRVRPLLVFAGDRVLFAKLAGVEFQLDGEPHLILREDDVLAVLK